jgi:hypothetical protein
MPWAFIPFLLLLSVWVAPEREIVWDVQSLFIPVSAWIGYRYGPAGVKAVFYACIPLFVFQFNGDVDGVRIRFGANGGVLFSAMAFAWFVSSPKNPTALISYLIEKPRRLWWLLVLPLTYFLPDFGAFGFSLNSFQSVNASFFIIGLVYPRENFRRLWRVVGGIFLIGVGIFWALSALGERSRLDTEFGSFAYAFYAPQDVISIVIFLFAGYWCRSYLENGTLPPGPFSLGTPALLIAMMIFGELQIGLWPGFGSSVGLTGDIYVPTLCCFLAGLFYRKRGFLIVLAPTLILALLSPVFEGLTQLGGGLLPGKAEIYIWTTPPAQATTGLVAFFLWTCVGAQLRAFMRDELQGAAASDTPARVGAS